MAIRSTSGRTSAQRGDGEQAEGAAADERDLAGVDLGGGVHGAGGGLDEHRGLVGEVGGHRDELALVGDHQRRPAAAGALAEAALQAGLEVAEADALAVVDPSVGARRAHRADAAGDAAEDGHDDGALPVVEVAHDLVARGERERHDRLEPARRRAVDGRQVGAADARQARPQPHPAGAGQLGRVDVAAARAGPTLAPPPGASRPATMAAANLAGFRENTSAFIGVLLHGVDLADAAAPRAAPLRADREQAAAGAPSALSKCSTSQPRLRARAARRVSGFTATGKPTASSIGRSEVESA